MSNLVSLTQQGNVAVITINNPPVNALSPGVPEGIQASLEKIRTDTSVQGVVLIGGGRTFIAGADIKEFEKITSGQKKRDIGLESVLSDLEDFPKPVVCAIHGTAFGGGLETAMACHYRVAVASALVGQPEVKLGLIPGAGGTQRLPRLVGVAKAAEMCAGGEPVPAPEALKSGVIDQLIEGDLLQGAVAFVQNKPPRKTRDLGEKLADPKVNAASLSQVRQAVEKRARGLLAPFKGLEAIEAAATLPFNDGLKREGQLFQECLFSEQSKSLIHVFFGERAVAKIPGLPHDTPIKEIRKAAVVGAGTMGTGITMAFANAGIPVHLKESKQEFLDRGLDNIKKNYLATMKKGRLTPQQVEQRLALIRPTLTYDSFSEADVVVEAVFEAMALKKEVFAQIDPVTRPDAILASNTSTLNIDEIASATSRPTRVIGTHFFSPANVMRLLEVVRGKATAPDVIATAMALSKKLGKIGVLVGNCRGFVGNRMYGPYQHEAQFLAEEGASIEEIDRVATDFGWAMGPFAVADLAGLDVSWRIRKEYRHLERPGERQPLVADLLCEMGRFGQKTGAGWYRYAEGNRNPLPDPDVGKLLRENTLKAGIPQRKIGPEEIIDRTLFSLVNEGAKILEEGFALRAVDIDIIYINGYGFPPYRGGPMWYADTVGLKKVLARIVEFEKSHGTHWAPAPLLRKLVEKGQTFADFDRARAM